VRTRCHFVDVDDPPLELEPPDEDPLDPGDLDLGLAPPASRSEK